MADLRWDEVSELFDPERLGKLPDVFVVDTSVQDWQAVFDLVESSGWAYEYQLDNEVSPLPAAAEVLALGTHDVIPTLHVRLAPNVLVIFRPWSAEEIDFDVDLRELRSQQGVDLLCDLLTALGRRLGKPVELYPEGGRDTAAPVLGYDPTADRVVLRTSPGRTR